MCMRKKKNVAKFYGDKGVGAKMSPTMLDVYIGLGVYCVLLLVLGYLLITLPLLLIGATLIIILGISAVRSLMGHSFMCGIRWSVFFLFGLGRWFSF